MDVKLQVYRGDAGPDHVDFRESTGGFLGSPEDEHRTVAEGENIDEETAALVLEAAPIINKLFARMTAQQQSFGKDLATLLGLAGSGPVKLAVRLYDE